MRPTTCILMFVLFLPAVHGAAGSGACTDTLVLADPPNDAELAVASADPLIVDAPPEIDFLNVSLQRTMDELVYKFQLAASPVETPPPWTFRYWLGFTIRTPDGSDAYMDIRIAGTTTYSNGELVAPNEWDSISLGVFPILWNGTTAEIRIPVDAITHGLDLDHLDATGLIVTSEGRDVTDQAQGAATGGWFVDRGYLGPVPPIHPCTGAPTGEATATSDETSGYDASWMWWSIVGAVVFTAGGFALGRFRR